MNCMPFLLADFSSGYDDSMIEVVTGMVPISLNSIFML